MKLGANHLLATCSLFSCHLQLLIWDSGFLNLGVTGGIIAGSEVHADRRQLVLLMTAVVKSRHHQHIL